MMKPPEKKRLYVLTEGYPNGQNLAGVFHRDQLHLLSQHGFDITVIGPTPWVPPGFASIRHRWKEYADLPAEEQDGALRILRPRYLTMPRENRIGLVDIFQSIAVRALQLPAPDALLAFFAIPLGAVARRLASTWMVPYLVGMLGDDVNIYPHLNPRYARLLKEVLRDAACAFANGPTLAKTAEALTGQPVRSLSIGVSADRFRNLPSKAEARRQLGLPQDRYLALYVGALTRTKGMEEYLRAMTLLQHHSLLGVCVGTGPYYDRLAAAPNIRCLGMRPAAEVAMAMAASDILVHPSHYEGLPTVLVEAALAGLPILTTDAPGCIDMAEGGCARHVPVGNADALASELELALGNPEIDVAYARSMAAKVNSEYRLDINTTTLAQLIHASIPDTATR